MGLKENSYCIAQGTLLNSMQQPKQGKNLKENRYMYMEYPLEEGIAIHFNILAQRIPWTEKPGGLQSMGSQRVTKNIYVHENIMQYKIRQLKTEKYSESTIDFQRKEESEKILKGHRGFYFMTFD